MSFDKETLGRIVDKSLKEASSVENTSHVYCAEKCYRAVKDLLRGVASVVVFNLEDETMFHGEHCVKIIEALQGGSLEALYCAIFLEPFRPTVEAIRLFDIFMSMKTTLSEEDILEVGCGKSTAEKLMCNAAVIRNDVFRQLDTLLGVAE